MKFLVVLVTIFSVLTACNGFDNKAFNKKSNANLDTANFTKVQWIDSLKDIGSVPAGEVAKVKFKFKNTGTRPLVIVAAKPGCGCTVADYPKEPIAPGATGTITANYDVNKNSHGEFRKNIKVTTNTKQRDTYIFFYGSVINTSDSAGSK